jgi:hypothetical protein
MSTLRYEKQDTEWVIFLTSDSGTVREYRTPIYVPGIPPWPDRELTEEILKEAICNTPESCKRFFRSLQIQEMLKSKVENGTPNQGEIGVTRL